MSWIIDFYYNLESHSIWFFLGAGIILFGLLVVNLSVNPYQKQIIQTKKCLAAIKKSTKKTYNKSLPVPEIYRAGWERYKVSKTLLPSQCLIYTSQKQIKCLYILGALAIVALLPFTIASAYFNRFDWMFFVPLMFAIGYCFVVSCVESILAKRIILSKKLYKNYVGILDFYYGKAFFSQNENEENAFEEDIAKNEIEEIPLIKEKPQTECLTAPPTSPDFSQDYTIKRVNFLVSNGVKPDTAEKLAALLKDNDKPRSVETQKELNKVLNETLQLITKKRYSA